MKRIGVMKTFSIYLTALLIKYKNFKAQDDGKS
jgi:hypothetical protein